MATIKSYTDISQSKTLSKILQLESADMIWILANPDLPMIKAIAYEYSEKSEYYEVLPAWSLAALLSVIPYNVSISRAVYRFKLVKFSDHWECYHENFGRVSTEIFKADNPVDACVNMLEKLYELNLL